MSNIIDNKKPKSFVSSDTNKIHQLDEFKFQDNATYTLLSARKSGKSFMIRNLVYNLLKKGQVQMIYLFSYTADMDDSYNWIAKEYIINPNIMDKTIDMLFKMQKSMGSKAKKVLLIFDDFDITANSPSLDVLYTRGRHYNFTVILSAQITTKSISPALRNNTIYLFIRKLNAKTIKDNVFNMLLNSEFDSGQEFYEFVKEHNEDYTFILYFNDDRSSDDSMKLVKASNKKFKFEYKKTTQNKDGK